MLHKNVPNFREELVQYERTQQKLVHEKVPKLFYFIKKKLLCISLLALRSLDKIGLRVLYYTPSSSPNFFRTDNFFIVFGGVHINLSYIVLFIMIT